MLSIRLVSSTVLLCATTVWGQQMISVRSGLIHYTEGSVAVNGKQVENKNSEFSSLLTNQELRTTDGRAELLLTPGAFLRVGENSAIRMLSTDLSNTQVEVLEGTALVEVTELGKENAVSILFHGASLQIEKAGIYRADSTPARFRVYEGQAFVSQGGTRISVSKGREVVLDDGAVASAHRFDSADTDDLYRWSARRSSYIAMANVALAKSVGSNSLLGTGGCYSGCWGYNSAFGMYSFLPFGAVAFSPFGYAYWSPSSYYYAPYYYYPSGNYPVVANPTRPAPARGLPVVGGGRQSGGYGQSSVTANSSNSGGGYGRSAGGFGSGSSVSSSGGGFSRGGGGGAAVSSGRGGSHR